MRSRFLGLLAVFGLAALPLSGALGLGGNRASELERKETRQAPAGKKEPNKLSAQEIDKLIKDLDSSSYSIREQAYKQLLKTPGALGQLRRALAAAEFSAEGLRRVETLAEALDVEKLLGKLEGPQREVAYGKLADFGLNNGEELLRIFKTVDSKKKARMTVVVGKVRVAAIEAKRHDLAETMEESLLRCLRDRNHDVLYQAQNALTGLGHPSKKAIPIFIEILEKEDATGAARQTAECGLRDLGPAASEAIPTILKCFHTKVEVQPDVKGKSGEEVQGANDNAKDYIPGERAHLCNVLAAIGPKDERVFTAMKKAVRDPKESKLVRAAAISCVAKAGERAQEIIPELMAALQETRGTDIGKESRDELDKWELRRRALAALGTMKLSKEQIPALVEILGDPKEDPEMHSNALTALIHSREVARGSWRQLLQLIEDGDRKVVDLAVAETVVRALREIDPPQDMDRAALAREVRMTFDKILRVHQNRILAGEMDKTIKAIEKSK